MKLKYKFLFWTAGATFFVLAVAPSFSFARQYNYDSIDYDITVRENATVLVRELQAFNFEGEYHSGWRSIPYKGISAFSDIVVYDGMTGEKLVYSPRFLDKTDPVSWGKYTYHRNGDVMNIEWYYSAVDEVCSWTIEYTVYGALGFFADKDEFYWNLFTDYDVPVNTVRAFVSIPGNTYSSSDHSVMFYTSRPNIGSARIVNNRQFAFEAFGVAPGESVTIAVGWPRGIVDRGAFWRDWFFRNLLFFLSIFVILGTITMGVIYWYRTERLGKGRGTIIPEYEPPTHSGKRITPAMADIILKERVSNKAWSATVIDLSVRGYLKIEEDISGLSKIFGGFFSALAVKNYRITWVKEPDSLLEDFEKRFMFLLGRSFGTKEMKNSPSKSRAMYKTMMKLKEKLIKETEVDTGVYEKPLSREKIRGIILSVFIFGCVLSLQLGFVSGILNGGLNLLLSVSFVCAGGLWLFIKYEARLSHEGFVLREQWLGFKMYLETAERYRLANLTPETFEKYLPYAIIFGVEKKWGKAFDSLHMPPPSWYVGTYAHTAFASGGTSAVSSFSASAFSASFSSSFTSAFSSAGGGGGVSGGGGGAGGGGGGGGGGAG